MGGDDLDDEHLMWIQKVKATHSESSDDDVNDKSLDDEKNTKGKKRKLDTAVALTTEPLDQKKKSKSPAQLLLQSGRNIELQDAVEQAAFLTTAVKHYSLLEQQQQIDANGDVASTESLEILPQYCLGKPTTNCTKESSLLDRVREAISVKKMKQWKNVGSPCVVILCISARRAVALLKELAPLKVRTAKLFPKNGSVDEQRQQLLSSSIGLAVGTPHRLRQLTDDGKGGKLTWEHTKLVIFDCHVTHKQFTVTTLPDTAPHCMALMRDSVLAQLQKRKDCKVAFM